MYQPRALARKALRLAVAAALLASAAVFRLDSVASVTDSHSLRSKTDANELHTILCDGVTPLDGSDLELP